MTQPTICDYAYCKNPEKPLNQENSAQLSQSDWDGNKTIYANVHRECADAWAYAHGGMVVPDEPLPPRPAV